MNYKIKKFDGGGVMVATYTPMARQDTTAPSGASRSSAKSSDSDSKDDMQTVIDKKIYERLITEGGLVNDVNYFVDKLSGVNKQQLPYLDHQNVNNSIQTIKDLNRIQQNKQLWTSTYAQAKELGGLSEVAVGKSGEIFVKDNKTFKSINLDEYSKHRDKYNPLTVAELLRARQYDPNLVYNDSIFQVGEVAHGTKEILSKVDNIIKLVAEDQIKSEKHYTRQSLASQLQEIGVSKTPNQAQANQIASILETPGDQIKVVEDHSSKKGYKNAAYEYILSSLTKEEKLKLRAVATINGTTVEGWLQSGLTVGLSGDKSSETFEGEKPVDTLKDKAAKADNGAKSLSAFQMFHKGKLYDPNATFNLNDPQWDTMFKGTMESVGTPMTSKDEPIGTTSIGNLLTEAGYGMFLNGNQATFGDKKIDITNKNNVVITADAEMAKVYMPVKGDGTPDYDSLAKFKEIYAVYEANKNHWGTKTAMDHFKKYGYNITIDQTGDEKIIRDNSQVKPFLVTHGYTNNATDLNDNNPWVKELTSDEEDGVVPMLRQYWTTGTGKNVQDFTPKTGMWESTHYYKGLIAIPYRQAATAIVDAMANQGPREQISDMSDVQTNLTQSSQRPFIRNTSGAELNIK